MNRTKAKKGDAPIFPSWIAKNIYIWALLLFAIHMIFIDQQGLFTQLKLSKAIEELKGDKEYYKEEIIALKKEKKWMASNKEKFAREKYYLSGPKEDVFIFVEEE